MLPMPALTHRCQRFTYKPKAEAISSEVAFFMLSCSGPAPLFGYKAACNAKRVFLPSLLRWLIVGCGHIATIQSNCRNADLCFLN